MSEHEKDKDKPEKPEPPRRKKPPKIDKGRRFA